MAGGGTAPPLKLGDVLLLVGVSLLIGTLFIQEWDIPVKMNPEDEPLEGTSQSFSGDVLTISAVTEEGSDVRIEIFEDDEKVDTKTKKDDEDIHDTANNPELLESEKLNKEDVNSAKMQSKKASVIDDSMLID